MRKQDGKVVAEFLYTPKSRKHGTEIRIPVRLVQVVDRERLHMPNDTTVGRHRTYIMPGNTKSATFCVDIDKPKKLKVSCTDIEILRRVVFEQLDAAYKLDWVKHLLVNVRGDRPFSGDGRGLEVNYRSVDIATLEDGTEVHRSSDMYRGFEVHEGRPKVGEDVCGVTISLIVATPENVKAMKDFCKAIDDMRERMAVFLGPDAIETNLAGWRQLLPPPPGQPKRVVATEVNKNDK